MIPLVVEDTLLQFTITLSFDEKETWVTTRIFFAINVPYIIQIFREIK